LILSILIPTIPSREADFGLLTEHLQAQIVALSAEDKVEIISLNDDKRLPIGEKRQLLLEMAGGDYVAFIDDDDWVPDHYAGSILAAIEEKPDCIGFYQRCTQDGLNARFACLSNKYDSWAENQDGFHYVRTPNHLNPVKRSIALQVGYTPDCRYAEDKDYSDRLKASELIQTEVLIPEVMYFYRYRRAGTGF
jgi:glycosyltransferase involved in cell wall biosynthesis